MFDDGNQDEAYGLLFDLRRSVRYHMRRRGWYERCHTLTLAMSVIFGSVTVFVALKEIWGQAGAIYPAAVVTVLTALDLVIGNATKARLHADLARRFIELEQRLVRIESPTSEQLRELHADRLAIEAEEPPILRVLDTLCRNELLRAQGITDPGEFRRVPWLSRQLAHLVDLPLPSRPPKGEAV